WLAERDATTDADGRASLLLAAGDYQVRAALGGRRTATVVAEQTTRLQLVLPAGYGIDGVVVDHRGAPVSGAEILITDAEAVARAVAVTTTDAGGRFVLDGIDGPHLLAARHAEFAPSLPHLVEGAAGDHLRLRLVLHQDHGMVLGRVCSGDGQPVGGATVLLGGDAPSADRRTEAGRATFAPPPLLTTTDAAGNFAATALEPGSLSLQIRHPDFGAYAGSVQVTAGATTMADVVLLLPASVHGVVRTDQGAPGAFAIVWSGERHAFASVFALCDSNGGFRLAGLPAGVVALHASRIGAGEASTTLTLVPGQDAEWLPVLAIARDGAALRGRVVDAGGQPLAGWFVSAMAANGTGPMVATANDGRFSIDVAADAVLQVRVDEQVPTTGLPRLLRQGVRPGGPELELRIDDAAVAQASLRGRVVDPDGRGQQADVELLHRQLLLRGSYRTAADGTFAFAVPAGRMRVEVTDGEHPRVRLGEQQLPPGGQLDLGTITLQLGAAVFGRLLGPDGQPPASALLRVLDDHGMQVAGAEYAAGTYRTAALPPGNYVLAAQAEGLAPSRTDVTLAAGEQHQLDLALTAGVQRNIRITAPAAIDAAEIGVGVLDRNGQVLCITTVRLDSGTGGHVLEGVLWVGQGHFQVVAIAGSSWRGDCQFDVTDLSSPTAPLQIVMTSR
ncbi:MAG TPA: carboxypeptidase-like regulatory domain-containing protein, partial [Planctomycetota bacterium]|nr:carboxypeptidase-like regulatory domain-containing protein [Planctomycetota bacterium]